MLNDEYIFFGFELLIAFETELGMIKEVALWF